MSSEDLDSPRYLYKLCFDKKWGEMREHLERSDLSTDVKKQQIYCKDKDRRTTFSAACFMKAPRDIIESMVSITGSDIVYDASNKNFIPLHWVCHGGVDVEIMNVLVKIGKKKLVMEKMVITMSQHCIKHAAVTSLK